MVLLIIKICLCIFLAVPEILHIDVFQIHSFESLPLKYEVIAKGIPKPEAMWYHDGKPLTSDEHFGIAVDGVCINRDCVHIQF